MGGWEPYGFEDRKDHDRVAELGAGVCSSVRRLANSLGHFE